MDVRESDITLFFLQGSRAIRIAWLLEELELPYTLISAERASDGHAPPNFKKMIPTNAGNSPTIMDGSWVVEESSAITEYICEMYDLEGHMIPHTAPERTRVREWMAAAEGTFLLRGIVILYARMTMPVAGIQYLPEIEDKLVPPLRLAFTWLERSLCDNVSGGKFLVGNDLSAADIMLVFSVEAIFVRKLGLEAFEWPMTSTWLHGLMQRPAYKRAVAKTGYSLAN